MRPLILWRRPPGSNGTEQERTPGRGNQLMHPEETGLRAAAECEGRGRAVGDGFGVVATGWMRFATNACTWAGSTISTLPTSTVSRRTNGIALLVMLAGSSALICSASVVRSSPEST